MTQPQPLLENTAVTAFLASLEPNFGAHWLSKLDYVQLALVFASLRLPEQAEAAYSVYRQFMAGIFIPEQPTVLPVPDDVAEALRERQARFIESLEIIRSQEPRAIVKLADVLSSAGNRIVMRPAFVAGKNDAGKDTVQVSYHVYPADFEAALGFVVMLLVDVTDKYVGQVCRCKFTGCQRYFLTIKPSSGRPRRDYCCREHLEKARIAAGAARIREYRRKKRKERKGPARRKPK